LIYSFDLLKERLADAPLSAEQRKIWEEVCLELVTLHARLEAFEQRLASMAEEHAQEDLNACILTRPDFNREVARMLAFDERYGSFSSVVYFDIEDLETLRTQLGAEHVRAALQLIGDTLVNHVRRSDIVGRLAPDEFGILLPHCNNQDAWAKGEALGALLYEALQNLWGQAHEPQINYGVYTFREKEDVALGLKYAASHMTAARRGPKS